MKEQTMTDPIAVWHAEHDYFRRLLDLLERQVDVFHAGEQPNYGLMLDIIYYLRHFTDQSHHPREDVAFARLAARAPDLELQLARLAQEHRVIVHIGANLEQSLERAAADVFVPRADIEALAATYLVYYRSHIGREEQEVLPRAAEVLTAEDWDLVRDAAPAIPDPLLGDEPAARFRELRRQIALES
jgi:hemerythrin-like domain-containing protein